MEKTGVKEPSNPLLIDLVLSKIFENVDAVKDLKNVRLVCKQWRKESLPKWRDSATLRLTLSNKVRNTIPCACGCCPPNDLPRSQGASVDVDSFLQLVQNSTEQGDSCPLELAQKPFRQYRLENCALSLLRYIDDDDIDEIKRLFRVCGPHMRYLDLYHSTVYNGRFAKFFSRILSKELTNLEELSVLFVSVERWEESVFGDFEEDKRNPIKLPKLKKLSVGMCENQGEEVMMPTEAEWRNFFHYTPELKDLFVDIEGVISVFVQHDPIITGDPIRLSTMAYNRSREILLTRVNSSAGWTMKISLR